MAAGPINSKDGVAEILSDEAFGIVTVEERVFSENDNNVGSERKEMWPTTGADSISYVDLGGDINPSVEALLRRTLANCDGSQAGIYDERTLRAFLEQYRGKFDAIFDGTDYVHDQRVAKMIRIFDYCYRIGFDCKDFFNSKLNSEIAPEEAISTFRNFFRIATIIITEEIGRPEIVREMKISGVKNPNDRMLGAGGHLATTIRYAARERLDEIYAALVMLKSGIID